MTTCGDSGTNRVLARQSAHCRATAGFSRPRSADDGHSAPRRRRQDRSRDAQAAPDRWLGTSAASGDALSGLLAGRPRHLLGLHPGLRPDQRRVRQQLGGPTALDRLGAPARDRALERRQRLGGAGVVSPWKKHVRSPVWQRTAWLDQRQQRVVVARTRALRTSCTWPRSPPCARLVSGAAPDQSHRSRACADRASSLIGRPPSAPLPGASHGPRMGAGRFPEVRLSKEVC